MTITQAQADVMLVEDLGKYEAYVNKPEYVPIATQLNQNQFDAMVSFCYNCGPGNLKKLCAGRTIQQIANKILEHDKVLAGLTRRRKAELELFNKAVEVESKGGNDLEKTKVYVNGEKIEDGLILDGRAYVPLRAVGEALGAKVGGIIQQKPLL